jgi:branched-chain amino acid transport system substrate-binding protein
MPDSAPQQSEAPLQDRRKRRVWIVAASCLVALLIVVAAGAGFALQALHRPEPIVIALIDTMSGPLAASGWEARAATRLYFNEVNAAGGIDGHMLELEAYDDQGKPATAATKAAWIVDSRAVAVLGHSGSDTSMAAGPVYRNGHIAAVTGNATADGLTRDNRYYFSAASPNSTQAAFLAQYIHTVVMRHTSAFLRAPDVDLVGGPGAFSQSFLSGFQQADSGLKPNTFMLGQGANLDVSARTLADRLAREPEPRIIVLGLDAASTAPALKAIRRRGIRSMIILSSNGATENFIQQFGTEPEEKDEPGYFTDNLFAIAPVILDNTGLFGQGLATGYLSGTGKRAGWYAAGAEDAARVLVAAIRRARIGDTEATKQADREKVRDALAGIDNPENAVPGINGALYFDAAREMPRPMQYGYFHDGRFLSAPLQLVPVKDRDLVDIDHEIALGHMVQIGDQFFWLQRVVSTGIDLAQLNRIDTKEGTFSADFYLWLRYAGGDDLPSQVAFSDFSGTFDADHPLRSGVEDGITYRLWHVSGTFKASLNLHDYPFDTQALVIRLRNREHPREQIAYAIDTFGLRLDASGRSSARSDAFRDLQLWQVVTVAPFVSSYSIQSTLGEPALFGTSSRTEYGGYALAVVVQRNVIAFMVKALLPLFLLMLVVFATLFFPPSMAKERLTIPVTGILTSAVLLISITNQLPPLGYTVALEYLFYTFFLLCLMAMVTGLLSETLRNKSFHRHVIRVDLFGRIAYLVIVAITIGVYMWQYGATMV